MILYHVDCFDADFWILAVSEKEARKRAAQECGHTDVNECLQWWETAWGSQFETKAEIEIRIRMMGDRITCA